MMRRSCRAWATSLPEASQIEVSSTLQLPDVAELRCEASAGAVPGAALRSAHRCTVISTVGAATGALSSGYTPGARSHIRTAAPGPTAPSGIIDTQASIHGCAAAPRGKQPAPGPKAKWAPNGRDRPADSD